MRGQEFLDRLEGVDPELIEQASAPRKTAARRTVILRWAAAAAALALFVGALAIILPRVGSNAPDAPSNVIGTPSVDPDGGVFIPAVELPEDVPEGVSMDMIGLIVYRGSIYTQAEYITCSDEQKGRFVGDYLGTASGSIDEWSSQDDYATEFASNVTGDVYSVVGYDPSFRICIRDMYDGCEFIGFFENLNGITLRTGSDLYGDRLSLRENYVSVDYQTHDNWNFSEKAQYQPLEAPQELMDTFLTELYAAPFVDLGESGMSIYDTRQAHLWFRMADGTTVGLRLFENGYVGYSYQWGGAVVVSMPGETLTALLDACVE